MILITGATGTVGGELTQQLLEAGESLRVLTRDAARLAALQGRVEITTGDLSRPETLASVFQGISEVFLVTATTQQDANVLQLARDAGVRHLVKLSTLEAVDAMMIEHVKWHKEREDLIRASGLAWTFLRPTMFMSTALDWAGSIRQKGCFSYPGGEGKVPVIDPWDVAAVAAVALTEAGHEGKAYALTGPQALSFGELAAILSKILGKAVQYRDMQDGDAREMMRAAGLPDYVIEGLIGTFAVLRAGRLAECSSDVEKVTGRSPRSFEDWCRAHISAFQ